MCEIVYSRMYPIIPFYFKITEDLHKGSVMTDLTYIIIYTTSYLFIRWTLCVFRLELLEPINIECFLTGDFHERSDIVYEYVSVCDVTWSKMNLNGVDNNLHALDYTGENRISKNSFRQGENAFSHHF